MELVAGRFKESGNPDRPLSNEERTLMQRDLNIVYNQMVKEIAKNRNMPIEKVQQLADGSSMPGTLALKNGLIDALGGRNVAQSWFAEKLDKDTEDINFCNPVWFVPDEEK